MHSKLIAAGAGLVGYGALVGWAVTGDYFETKMKGNQRLLADIIEKKSRELDSANQLILHGGGAASHPATVEMKFETSVKTPEEVAEAVRYNTTLVEEPVREKYRGETPEETRRNLQDIIENYTQNPEDKEAFTHMAGNMVDPGPDNTPPFVISANAFAYDEEGETYEKTTLKYYPVDRVLVDDDDAVETKEIDSMIGWKNLDRFGDESDNPDVVFIRSPRYLTDFEVERTEEALPIHLKYGLDKAEYDVQQSAGLTRFRRGDVGD